LDILTAVNFFTAVFSIKKVAPQMRYDFEAVNKLCRLSLCVVLICGIVSDENCLENCSDKWLNEKQL
jgi:hypothetical protein